MSTAKAQTIDDIYNFKSTNMKRYIIALFIAFFSEISFAQFLPQATVYYSKDIFTAGYANGLWTEWEGKWNSWVDVYLDTNLWEVSSRYIKCKSRFGPAYCFEIYIGSYKWNNDSWKIYDGTVTYYATDSWTAKELARRNEFATSPPLRDYYRDYSNGRIIKRTVKASIYMDKPKFLNKNESDQYVYGQPLIAFFTDPDTGEEVGFGVTAKFASQQKNLSNLW